MTYSGWKNRQTWNVSLWLNNTEDLYREAVRFMQTRKNQKGSYYNFIRSQNLENNRTGDNIAWLGTRLDYKSLDEMMMELIK